MATDPSLADRLIQEIEQAWQHARNEQGGGLVNVEKALESVRPRIAQMIEQHGRHEVCSFLDALVGTELTKILVLQRALFPLRDAGHATWRHPS